MREAKKVFVTDFDGTMTTYDFYTLVSRQLLSVDTPDYWSEYRAGRLTHFEALRNYFAAIQADEATVLQLVEQMEIDPHLAEAVAELQQRGWKIVIASAGCTWYIERLLARAGVQIETHANPGHFETGHGLLMDLPFQSPFFSPTHGIDKAGLVKHYLDSDAEIAFAGDGFPDVPAALLTPAERRFARGDLKDVLLQAKEPFRPFHRWSDIARELL